jgi:transposase
MDIDTARLPNDPDALKAMIMAFAEKEKSFQKRIEDLEEYIRLLKNEIFGRKSEKRPEPDQKQLTLFGNKEPEEEPAEEKITVYEHTRKKRGRKPLPKHLPVREVICDIDENEKICGCGEPLSRCGQETSEKLEYIPAKMEIIRYVRYKYACRNCEGTEDEGATVKIAENPPLIIPKGIATPGLLAHILVSKFEDALPFYRQEKIFARQGVELGRATMCGWAVKVAKQCEPLLGLLEKEIRSGPLINADETTLQVMNEPGRANTTKSYMWVFRGGLPGKTGVMYQYHPTRSGKVAGGFLKNYRGYVQTDAYSGYDALEKMPHISLVGCWAHVRRKFTEVIKAAGKGKKGHAQKVLDLIGSLYAIEKSGRKNQYSPEQMVELRREKSLPVLEELYDYLSWLSGQTPPKGLLGKAVNYALKNWPVLVRYLEDGHITPDNNAAENALRPFVIGRKNWLFNGHPKGAAASAALYSLIETAKANGLKPYFYLKHLFEKLPLAETEDDYRNLLPQNLLPDQVALPAA